MSSLPEQITVLYVDDEPDITDVVAKILERDNERFTVRKAANADEALDILAESEVDCIVSDYDMPGTSGTEFLKTIRDDHPNLPFILFTGKGSENVANEAISAGATDYLQKDHGTEQYTILANRIVNAVSQFRSQQAVEETREFYSTILDQASDFVMVVDEDAVIDYVSPPVQRVLGYSPDDLEGTVAFDIIHPEDVSVATGAFQEIDEHPEREKTVEFRARHADGRWRWLEVRGRNLFPDPVISGIMVNARDITERREAQAALEDEEEFIEQALDALHDLFFVLSPDGDIVRTNQRAVDVTGYAEDTINSMAPTEFFVEGDREKIEESITEILETGDALFEGTLLTNDNERRRYEFREKRLTDEDGTVTGIVGVGRDITGRSLYEDRLEVSQRVLRHNLRNELNVVRGWVETIGENVSDKQGEMVDDVILTIDRLMELSEKTREMTELDYNVEEDSPSIDVEHRVRTILEEYRSQYPAATIELDVQSSDDLFLSIDDRFDTAFENAIQNAIEHNPAASPWVRVVVADQQQEVQIRISDDGPGMPEMEKEVLGKGKETPLLHGSGVGLWLIYWSVATAGGEITIEERDPTGSVIHLCFPLPTE